MSRKRSARLGAAVGAAAVAAMVVGALPAAAENDGNNGGGTPVVRPEKAFGLAGLGVLDFGPLAFVASPDGTPQRVELAGLGSVPGAAGAGLSGGLLTSEARLGFARSNIADLKVSEFLSANLITTTCNNGVGSFTLGGAKLLGVALPEVPAPGQTLDLSPLAKVSLNEQVRNADGSLTVTGIKLTILPGGVPSGGLPNLPLPTGIPGLPGIPSLPGLPAGIVPIAHVTQDGAQIPGIPGLPGEPEPTTSAPASDESSPAPSVSLPAPSTRTAPSSTTAPTSTTTPPASGPSAGIPGLPSIPGFPGLPIPSLPSPGEPLQTITIGSATCAAATTNPPNPKPPKGDDDHDWDHDGQDWDNDGHDKDEHGEHGEADHDEPDVDDADDAEAPEVAEYSLPVTG